MPYGVIQLGQHCFKQWLIANDTKPDIPEPMLTHKSMKSSQEMFEISNSDVNVCITDLRLHNVLSGQIS